MHTITAHTHTLTPRRLKEEGVEVMLGVDVMRIGEDRVVVRERSRPGAEAGAEPPQDTVLAADLIVWTAGE
jgi:NADH dehydrogenase FAD-containing subunit